MNYLQTMLARLRPAFLPLLLLASPVLVSACGGTIPVSTNVPSDVETTLPSDAADATSIPSEALPATAVSEAVARVEQAMADPTPTEEPKDISLYADLAARAEEQLDEFAQVQQFSGVVLLARGGEVILSKSYGDADRENHIPNTSQTRFRIGSLTKPITALIILKLQENGSLDIQDHVCDYVENCPAAWSEITIEQLLTHTSGIPDFTRFADYNSTKHLPTTLSETIDRFRDAPLEFTPGEHWNYTNSGYILLGQVIETITGLPYAEVVDKMVFEPLDMVNSGYDNNRDDLAIGYSNASGAIAAPIDMSIPHAAGGLFSTAEDLLKLDRALSEGSILSADLQQAMFTPHATIPDGPGLGYGYGWVIGEEFGQRIAYHNGSIEGYVVNMTRFLGDETLIVMLSNEEQTNPNAITRVLIQAVYAADAN